MIQIDLDDSKSFISLTSHSKLSSDNLTALFSVHHKDFLV